MPYFSSVVVCLNYIVIENVALIKLNSNHYCCVITYYKFITQRGCSIVFSFKWCHCISFHRSIVMCHRDVTKGKVLVQLLQCQTESAPLVVNRVKASENLGATVVALLAPAACGYVPVSIALWAISANVKINFGLLVTHFFIYICSGSLLYQHSIFNCGISWSQWKETKLWSSSQKNIAKRDSKTVDQKFLGMDSNVGHQKMSMSIKNHSYRHQYKTNCPQNGPEHSY